MSAEGLRRSLRTAVAALGLTAALFSCGSSVPAPQDRPATEPEHVLYILPFWSGLGGSSEEALAAEVRNLRRRLGPEGRHVRLGFSGYVFVSMDDWLVNESDRALIQAGLSGTIRQIDNYVGRARQAGIPTSFSVLTAIRERYDPVQRASEDEDVRSMQWYADNSVARGWWTHSRYARKARSVQEAYVREIGRTLANRMRRFPETLVAASGDGEVELAYALDNPATGVKDLYADYSPFVIAEFRDWLRHGGLYAPGAEFAGDGYRDALRYHGDASPAEDTNGDGHTLNGDFGTTFTSWQLRHFDWTLDDAWRGDDRQAIPLVRYDSPRFNRLPGGIAGGFDAPRVPRAVGSNAWWDLWVLFKQTLLQHHNRDFAKWVTTSPDPDTGAKVPPERWFSYQIPSDYGYDGSPEIPTERFRSSMSAWWTGDIAPYGGVGITAFNLDFGDHVKRTLRRVAPLIAERGRHWGIIEWNPGLLPYDKGVTSKMEVYREEMDLIERYRPTLLQPFAWGDKLNRVEDTGFEVAMRELIARVNDTTPSTLTATRTTLRLAVAKGSVSTPAQIIDLNQTGWTPLRWSAPASESWLSVTPSSGLGSGRLRLQVNPTDPVVLAAGHGATLTARVTASAPGLSKPPAIDVTVTVLDRDKTSPPYGQIDLPAQNTTGVTGPLTLIGWVLDDVGVANVKLYRECFPFDDQAQCRMVEGVSVVYLGDAELAEGARPDVEAAFATQPLSYKAGWGYAVQTPTLPDVEARRPIGGRGPVKIYAFATDAEGKITLLGRATNDHTPTTVTLANPR